MLIKLCSYPFFINKYFLLYFYKSEKTSLKIIYFLYFFEPSCKTLKPLLKKALRECRTNFRILLPKSMILQLILATLLHWLEQLELAKAL